MNALSGTEAKRLSRGFAAFPSVLGVFRFRGLRARCGKFDARLAQDRRRVHPAALRRATDHAPRPQRILGARMAKDARAQRGARLLRLRPRGRIGGGTGPLRGTPLAGVGAATWGSAPTGCATAHPRHRIERGPPQRWPRCFWKGNIVLMAENIKEHDRPLSGFKRRYRKAEGIKGSNAARMCPSPCWCPGCS